MKILILFLAFVVRLDAAEIAERIRGLIDEES